MTNKQLKTNKQLEAIQELKHLLTKEINLIFTIKNPKSRDLSTTFEIRNKNELYFNYTKLIATALNYRLTKNGFLSAPGYGFDKALSIINELNSKGIETTLFETI